MTRDYANRFQTQQRQRRRTSPWLILLAGLLGLALLFAIFIAKHHHHKLVQATELKNTVETSKVAQVIEPAAAPQFDFYHVLSDPNDLSGLDTNAPEDNLSAENDSAPNNAAPIAGYLLQVAAFREPGVAQDVKTTLAASGYTVRITTTATGWLKIMAGPYTDKAFALKIKQQLEKQHYRPLLVKSRSVA